MDESLGAVVWQESGLNAFAKQKTSTQVSLRRLTWVETFFSV